jgi:hypothetical protein
LQNAEHSCAPTEEEQSAAAGGNVLVVTGAGAEKVTEFVVTSTEPGGRLGTPEAAHRSVAAFDAPVVLFQSVIEVAAGSMADILAQLTVSGGLWPVFNGGD